MQRHNSLSRRSLLSRIAVTATIGMACGWRAVLAATQRRTRTPSQAEGPYYPVQKPANPGSDLIRSASGIAEGVPLTLDGRVLNVDGTPATGAKVEIWQADQRGIYRHPRAPNQGNEDPAFTGFGASVADSNGRYSFLTIVPVPYTGRPPHIHVKVWVDGKDVLTTQLYLKGHPDNDRDGLLAMLLFRNKEQLMLDPRSAKIDTGLDGQSASFDLVV